MTIRAKIILFYSGLLATVIVLFGLVSWASLQWILLSATDRTLTETALRVVNESVAVPVGVFGTRDRITVGLPSLDVFRASGLHVQVWDVVTQPGPMLVASSPDITSLSTPLDGSVLGSVEPVYARVTIGDTPLRVLTYPVRLDTGQLFASVQVATSLGMMQQAMDRMIEVFVGAMLVALVGCVVVGWLLADRVLRPVDNIINTAAGIVDANDLDKRLALDGPVDEVGRLTLVFNQMMDRLQSLFDVQRRFVADVSHELRTPLTAVRGNLELIRKYGMDEQALDDSISEVQRMARMVDDLLLLARADYGGLQLELDPLDLDTTMAEVYRDARTYVTARNRALEVQMTRLEPVRVNGNNDRIKQLVLNLVSNAVKFTPDGGSILLSLTHEGANAVIRVKDTGAGIAPEHLPRIFDRFYQADAARFNADHEGGTGLGLSIAKWIAEAHRGSIMVESTPGQGTTFTIAIPTLAHTAKTLTNLPRLDAETARQLKLARRV